jgi:hypothetical protein
MVFLSFLLIVAGILSSFRFYNSISIRKKNHLKYLMSGSLGAEVEIINIQNVVSLVISQFRIQILSPWSVINDIWLYPRVGSLHPVFQGNSLLRGSASTHALF